MVWGSRSRGLIGLWLISVGGNPSSGKRPHHHFPIKRPHFTTNSSINSALKFIFNCGHGWNPSPNRIGWIDYWAISNMEKITTSIRLLTWLENSEKIIKNLLSGMCVRLFGPGVSSLKRSKLNRSRPSRLLSSIIKQLN